jgi:hypothetical protein
MSLIQLIVPREVAHDTIAELGELGDVQFKDVRGSSLLGLFCSLTERYNSLILT